MDWQQIKIKNPDDRRLVAGILIENGYEVRVRRVKPDPVKSTKITVLEYKEVEG